LFEELDINFREPVISYPLSLKLLEDKAEKYDWKIGGLNIEEERPVVRGGSINVGAGASLLEWRFWRQRFENLMLGDGGLVWDGFIQQEEELYPYYNYSSQIPIPYSAERTAVLLEFRISNHYPFKREYDLLLAFDDLGNIIGSWNITVNAESWNCPERDISSYLDHIPPGNHTLYFLVYDDDDGNMCDEMSTNITVVAPNPRVNVSDCRQISPHEIEFKLKLANEGHAGNFSGVHVRVENGTFISADKGDFESVTAYDESGRPINVEGSRILEFYNRSVDGGAELETGWIRVRAEKGIVKLLYRGWIKDDSARIYNPYSKEFESYIARDPAEYEPVNPPYSRHAFDDTFSFLNYSCHERPITVTPTPQVIYVPDDYAKIQWAVDNANAGDTIIVRDGIYTENIVVDKPLTIKSENGSANCIVQAANPNNPVFEVTADHTEINGFTVKNATGEGPGAGAGIYLRGVEYCLISNNTAISNEYGICLSSSSNNKVQNNIASSNTYEGILVASSSDNILKNNNCSNNGEGIHLDFSSNNTLKNNSMSNNRVYNFAITGHWLSNFIQDIDTSNTVDGKPIYYLVNEQERTIDSSTNAGYVAAVNCTNVLVKDLTLAIRNTDGILFAYTTNSRIENVSISNTYYSIRLVCSFDNSIVNNDLSSTVGIYSSSNNIIYLNNIRNVYSSYDSSNIWNSTEKITYTYNGKQYTNYLGNYWSDYTGSDADEDGISDTPYSIDSDKDNYPLMERFENYFVLPPQYGVCVCVPSCAPDIIQAFPGSNISFVLKVKNTGTEEDTVLLSVTDGFGWDFEYPEKIELAPGEEKYFFLNFTPPYSASNRICVKAVSKSDPSKVSKCDVQYFPSPSNWDPLSFRFSFNTREELEVEEVSEFVKVSEFSPTDSNLILSIFVEPVGGRVKNIIKVKSKETGESVAIPFTTVDHTAITTDFKFPDDSYSFRNWGKLITIPILDWELSIGGRCFGMSETCLLFYEGIYELPEGKSCLYEVQKDDKTTLYNIPVSIGTLITIHQIRFKNTLTDWLKEFAKTNNKAEYINLKQNISRNEPVILGMLGGKSSKGKEKVLHACVAYGIIEVGNKAYILMYDNNHPYKNNAIHFSLSHACAVLDKEKWSFKYDKYCKMIVVKATPLFKAEIERLLSEGNISTLPRSYISNITIQRE